MNRKAKGTRNGHRSIRLLEAAGYACTAPAAERTSLNPYNDSKGEWVSRMNRRHDSHRTPEMVVGPAR